MRKKSLIASIVLTILNLIPTLFCAYLNAGIVYEGEGALGLIAIIPYTFMIMPVVIILLVLSFIFSIKAIKSESNKISLVAKIFLGINILIAIAVIIMIGRIVPLYF